MGCSSNPENVENDNNNNRNNKNDNNQIIYLNLILILFNLFKQLISIY